MSPNRRCHSRAGLLLMTLSAFILLALPLAADEPEASTRVGDLWVEMAPSALPLQAPRSPYADLVDQAGPAVVSVYVQYDIDDLPPHARGGLPGSRPGNTAQGSGFIIHPDGYVLTNFHVIDHAQSVLIILNDDREFEAEVIGVDPSTDVALMQVRSPDPLPTVPLGNSSTLRPGEYAVAIGNPLGLTHSVTAGIISAVGRRDLPIEGEFRHGNFIQTDTPINPGNSGGPLLNMNGEVIGINTAINRHGQGISFAIPIDMVKALLPQLEERGYVERSWLGVRIQPMDVLLARSFDLADNRGALVTEVLSGSPASRAGILEQDVIVGIDGERLVESEALPWIVSTTPAGTTLTLQVMRNGDAMDVDVEIAAIPDQTPPPLPGSRPSAATESQPLGVQVTPMTSRLARQLSAPQDTGVVVTSLSDTSPARHAGLRHRDVILEVGSTAVDTEREFLDALDEYPDGDVIRLKVLRRGRAVYMAFTR